jgi:hypothetical protein
LDDIALRVHRDDGSVLNDRSFYHIAFEKKSLQRRPVKNKFR